MVFCVQKEIHEQPDSLLQTMSGRVNLIGSHKVSCMCLSSWPMQVNVACHVVGKRQQSSKARHLSS